MSTRRAVDDYTDTVDDDGDDDIYNHAVVTILISTITISTIIINITTFIMLFSLSNFVISVMK